MHKRAATILFPACFLTLALFAPACVIVTNPDGNGNVNDNMFDDDLLDEEVRVGDNLEIATRLGATTGTQEGEVCDGWFPVEANHILFVDQSLGMAIGVTSESEPRLWVLCGQSNFCGEQTDTNTWSLSRFWTTGTCEIRIGTAEQGGTLDYTLELTPS